MCNPIKYKKGWYYDSSQRHSFGGIQYYHFSTSKSACFYLVYIYEDGKFNMNGKLAEKLGGKEVAIKFLPDGKYLCLQENGNILFPKKGSRKIPEIVEILKSKGITFPAKYELQYSKITQSWQGVCEENPIKLPSRKVRNSKK